MNIPHKDLVLIQVDESIKEITKKRKERMTKNKQKQKQRKNNYKNKTNLNKIISVNLKCYKKIK